MAKKTDNANLPAKLALRRHFLRKYHADGSARVLDCCQGSGVIWKKLRAEFPVANYWGVDLKAKPGRLKIDSMRILAQPGWQDNVIDIDTYGSPWKHWNAMLPNVTQPLTVFLTRGSHSLEVMDAAEREAIGLTLKTPIPAAFWPKLHAIDSAIIYVLTKKLPYGLIISEIVEAPSSGTARYFGVRLEPTKASGPELSPPSRTKPKRTVKESARV